MGTGEALLMILFIFMLGILGILSRLAECQP